MKDADIIHILAEKVMGWKFIPAQRAWFKDGNRIVSGHAWDPINNHVDAHALEGSIPETDRIPYIHSLDRILRFDEPRAFEIGSTWLCLRATPRQKSLAIAEVCCGVTITLRRQACAG